MSSDKQSSDKCTIQQIKTIDLKSRGLHDSTKLYTDRISYSKLSKHNTFNVTR